MKSIILSRVFLMFILFALPAWIHAHCQVPCGIYDDELRLNLMLEHATTIGKSIKMAAKESGAESPNYNQLVRWINNKEVHADEVQSIACQYFLAQRIKEDADHYQEKLLQLHRIVVYSMKCKQSLDPANVDKLELAIRTFQALYFEKLHHKH